MQKVLIIRTLQSDLLIRLVRKWRESDPEQELYLLAHSDSNNLQYYGEEFKQIFFYPARQDFSLFHMRPALFMALRRQRFDKVILPKKTEHLEGFENVVLLVSALRARSWFHCGIDGELRPAPGNYLLKCALTTLASLVLAPLVFFAMVTGLGAIRLFQQFSGSRRRHRTTILPRWQ